MSILILLATHNGAEFLPRQLDSLSAQTYDNWQLLVRDDGSSDRTKSILEDASIRDPRIEILPEDNLRLGPAGNFSQLMQHALTHTASAIALCDQDDVWVAHKLERQRAVLTALEQRHGHSRPILIHSDLDVVDRYLKQIHPSMMRFQLINHPKGQPAVALLAQNHAVGCSMLMNRALLELATPVPADVHMHDWWIALCAEFVGIREYLPEALVRYRQHGENRVGAQGVLRRVLRPWLLGEWLVKMNATYRASWQQAMRLSERLRERVCKDNTDPETARNLVQLEQFLSLRHHSNPLRTWRQFCMGMRSQNPMMSTLYSLQSLLLRLEEPVTRRMDSGSG